MICVPHSVSRRRSAHLPDNDAPHEEIAEMENPRHEAGTLSGCTGCRDAAYEPGWYQMLRRLSGPAEERSLHLACDAGFMGSDNVVADPWLREAPPRVSTAHAF